MKEILKEVDETIVAVCKKVKENDLYPEECSDIVKALASLIEARAQMHTDPHMREVGNSAF